MANRIRAISCLFLTAVAGSALPDERVLQALQSINPSHYHQLEPESLGHVLHVVVKLPPGYDQRRPELYPTVYLLDGGATLPMLAGYHNYLVHQGTAPKAIIVALSYGSDDFEGGNYRSTDYTAPTQERAWWGGAGTFQDVLREEVLPLIDATYRADPLQRVLFGQSIGGQFVLFSALTQPDLFWGRIASNPALHRNLPFFMRLHTPNGASAGKLFVASASNDEARFRGPAMTWIEHWSNEPDLPWKLHAISIEGYGHFSLITESYRQGMAWLFDEALRR